MRDHINLLIARLTEVVYSSAPGRKKKMKTKDFMINYKKMNMPKSESMMDDFKQFEKSNGQFFKVVNNG